MGPDFIPDRGPESYQSAPALQRVTPLAMHYQNLFLNITNGLFVYFNNLCRPYTVDCFSNYYNCKLN